MKVMCGDIIIELSECAHCTQVYWDFISEECPDCGSPYIAIYETEVVFEPEENFDPLILLDPDLQEKIKRGCSNA